jgi:hypothetical protein
MKFKKNVERPEVNSNEIGRGVHEKNKPIVELFCQLALPLKCLDIKKRQLLLSLSLFFKPFISIC